MKKFLPILLLLLASCASEEIDENAPRPHPAAYSMDSFSPPTPRPEREPRKLKFYFKECSVDDSKSYYSTTSYFCDDLNN
ncbi:MAG: hypothetical protein KDD37_08555 [Bdellovibrionales bacterium]|nr:hypothetical protein [Bdellovibrionales bacterium]